MKQLSFGFVLAGVIVAVLAGLIVAWIQKTFSAPTETGAQTGWWQTLAGGNQYIYGQGSQACEINPASANARTCSFGPAVSTKPAAASTYPNGAPTSTYRSYQRIGTWQVATR